jgi:hypothetical protein
MSNQFSLIDASSIIENIPSRILVRIAGTLITKEKPKKSSKPLRNGVNA